MGAVMPPTGLKWTRKILSPYISALCPFSSPNATIHCLHLRLSEQPPYLFPCLQPHSYQCSLLRTILGKKKIQLFCPPSLSEPIHNLFVFANVFNGEKLVSLTFKRHA